VSKVDEANKLDQFFNVLYSFKFFLSLVILKDKNRQRQDKDRTNMDRDKIEGL
jgi:hypothetical protein